MNILSVYNDKAALLEPDLQCGASCSILGLLIIGVQGSERDGFLYSIARGAAGPTRLLAEV